MYVAVQHDVKNPVAFQTRGQAMVQEAPADLRPLQFLPDTVGRKAACVWEGVDIDAVRAYIDGKLGDSSIQEYFEIAAQYSLGLPTAAAR